MHAFAKTRNDSQGFGRICEDVQGLHILAKGHRGTERDRGGQRGTDGDRGGPRGPRGAEGDKGDWVENQKTLLRQYAHNMRAICAQVGGQDIPSYRHRGGPTGTVTGGQGGLGGKPKSPFKAICAQYAHNMRAGGWAGFERISRYL